MKKLLSIASLALSLLFLSACDSMDGPSPLDTRSSEYSNELNPDGLPSDAMGSDNGFGDAGIPGRGINDLGGSFDPDNINPADVVETIYFGFDQYAVPQNERAKIKNAVDFYSSNAGMRVILVGHTDWLGTEEYNMLLSDKRAKAVQDYAASLGLDPMRVEIIARGEAGAITDVPKNSAEAQNDRRVEIVKFQ